MTKKQGPATLPGQEAGLGIAVQAATASAPAVAGAMAAAKAEIEAAYAIAVHRPRNLMDARQRIMGACSRPQFAGNPSAVYRRPVGGGQWVEGPGIRLAEEFARSMGNIRAMSEVRRDDDEALEVMVWATDLETNTTFSQPVSMKRTLERRTTRDGQVVVGQRETSKGDVVYIVKATDEEMSLKALAGVSKALRNCIIRLTPQDIIEDAVELIKKIRREQIDKDPLAAGKKLADAFGELGVKPSDLEAYLGRPLGNASTAQLDELRSVYAAIRDDVTTWAAVIENKGQTREKGTLKPDDLSPPKEGEDGGKGQPPATTGVPTGAPSPETVKAAAKVKAQAKARAKARAKAAKKAAAAEGKTAPETTAAETLATKSKGNAPGKQIDLPGPIAAAAKHRWLGPEKIAAYCQETYKKTPMELTQKEGEEVVKWILTQ